MLSSPTLSDHLRVRFGRVESGWIDTELTAHGSSLTLVFSYTPYDSIADLASTVVALVQAKAPYSARVSFNLEPEEYDLVFDRSAEGLVTLQALSFPGHGRPYGGGRLDLHVVEPAEDLARAFWRALRELGGRISPQEFEREWRRPWPLHAIGDLTALLKAARPSGRPSAA